MAADLSIKLYESDEAFDLLRRDWQRLFAAAETAPFTSWEWAATWFRFFGANRSPFILAAFENGELVALLPLFFERKKIFGMPLKKLALIGSEIGGAAYLDVLALPSRKSAATAAFLDFLDARGEIDVLELESVNADSVLLKQIRQRDQQSKFRLRIEPQNVCQYAEVGGEPEQLLARIFNDTAKKKLRRIKKLDGFEFRQNTATAEVQAAFQRFIHLHDGNWTQKGGSEVTGHRRLLDFHLAAVTANSERGAIFFDELWIENRCVASLYGFVKSGAYYYYSSGYDEQLSKLSPMVTLYNLSIENGLKQNISTFDFLSGNQSYKTHWTTGSNQLVTVSLRRKNAAALVHEKTSRAFINLRDFLNYAMPSGLLENSKEARRRWKRKFRLALPHGEINREKL